MQLSWRSTENGPSGLYKPFCFHKMQADCSWIICPKVPLPARKLSFCHCPRWSIKCLQSNGQKDISRKMLKDLKIDTNYKTAVTLDHTFNHLQKYVRLKKLHKIINPNCFTRWLTKSISGQARVNSRNKRNFRFLSCYFQVHRSIKNGALVSWWQFSLLVFGIVPKWRSCQVK